MVIRKRNEKEYELIINNQIHEVHPSAQSAAGNVYMHVTSCWEWDSLDGKVDAPRDISEWNKI